MSCGKVKSGKLLYIQTCVWALYICIQVTSLLRLCSRHAPTIESFKFAASFRGISRLGSASIFLWWFKLAHIQGSFAMWKSMEELKVYVACSLSLKGYVVNAAFEELVERSRQWMYPDNSLKMPGSVQDCGVTESRRFLSRFLSNTRSRSRLFLFYSRS